MRAISTLAIAGLCLAGACMPIAIVGRALDWSPYALTMLGAGAGLIAGIGVTLSLMLLADEDAGDEELEA